MKGSLSKINIEIDLASNPALRDMFKRPEACTELDPFLRWIDLTGPEYRAGEIVAIDLTGPPHALRNFANKFLRDEASEVYSLSYDPE
jgi:hypothetical protein